MKVFIFTSIAIVFFQSSVFAKIAPSDDVAVAAVVQSLVNTNNQQTMIDQLSTISPSSFPQVLRGLAAANVTGTQLDMAMHAIHTILARLPEEELKPIMFACFNALESPAYFAAFLQLGMYQPKPGYSNALLSAGLQSLQSKSAEAQVPFISSIQALCPAVNISGSGSSLVLSIATGAFGKKDGSERRSAYRLSESATDNISIQVK